MITITAQPKDYTPSGNSIYFEFNSNQTAQPDFVYVVKLTDVISGFEQFYRLPVQSDISEDVKFDVMSFAKSFCESELQPTIGNPISYGWKNYNRMRTITVNIGESYGGSPTPVYYPGTDIDIKVWNGALYKSVFFNYQESDLIFSNGNPAILSSLLTEYVYDTHSSFIHVLDPLNEFGGVRIVSRDVNGNVIQTSNIDNPYLGSSPFESDYLCLDVGLRSLNLISSGLVTGSYPPVSSNAYLYQVSVYDTQSPPTYTLKKTFIIKDCINFTPYAVHYLSRTGSFDTCLFDRNSFKSTEIDRQEYDSYYFQRANPSNLENSQAYGVTKSTNIIEQESYTLNTGYITNEERLKYTQLISSPLVYLDLGASGLLEIIPVKRQWDVTPKVRGKKENLSCEFRVASKESRQ
jgi:hypothetical protein